jgi:hypothetical protein
LGTKWNIESAKPSLCIGSIWTPRSRRYGAVVYNVTRFLSHMHQ